MIVPLILATALAAEIPAPLSPTAREVAPGVRLIPGGIRPGRGPDGNTIVFDAPDGLIVVDTGRHDWHSDAILAFAGALQRPIVAIVNTHWHLDHTSGNRRLRRIFSEAPVYATQAVDAAIAPGGFLQRGLAGARARLTSPDVPANEREETELYLATMEHAESLLPDIAVTRSQRLRMAGRRLDVRVTNGAVSAADIWIYDRRSRVAVLGDLVTFPAPFFESACPEAWRDELDTVWATPFRVAIPGHGEPMTRDQFNTYRIAYGAFVDCVMTDAEATQCAALWVDGVALLLADDPARTQARAYATHYVGFLRENGGASPDCALR